MKQTEKEKIKLNIPCSICDKELFLGTSLVSFGDNRTPVHLECYNKAGKSEAIKELRERDVNFLNQNPDVENMLKDWIEQAEVRGKSKAIKLGDELIEQYFDKPAFVFWEKLKGELAK